LIIPKKIKAFGRLYSVHRDNNITDKIDCWGYIDHSTDEIVLKKRSLDFTMGHERQTFMHEIIHLVDDNLKVGLDEKQTQLLSAGLTTILADNKLDISNDG